MRGLEEPQAAELDVGDVAAGQLQLEGGTVAGGAEQDRLVAQGQPGLAVGQDLGRDMLGLGEVVADHDQPRPLRRAPGREQLLAVALARQPDHGVGGGQDRLGRAVVLLERHDPGRRREAVREVQDVAHRGGPEGVDRLRVVADHGDARARRA